MAIPRPVFLFTDFGWSGPYVGQLEAAILNIDQAIPVVHLMHDAPAMRPDLAAYLLGACCRALPDGAIVVAVVDPGVGGERDALLVETPRCTLVGPDNGLLSQVDDIASARRLDWRPGSLSASFHGRDLFAPAAALLACGNVTASSELERGTVVGANWPADAAEIVYIDGFGNAMTGVDARNLNKNKRIVIGPHSIEYAETFCRVDWGELFWYQNSQGLVEIAANGASAASLLSLALGSNFLID